MDAGLWKRLSARLRSACINVLILHLFGCQLGSSTLGFRRLLPASCLLRRRALQAFDPSFDFGLDSFHPCVGFHSRCIRARPPTGHGCLVRGTSRALIFGHVLLYPSCPGGRVVGMLDDLDALVRSPDLRPVTVVGPVDRPAPEWSGPELCPAEFHSSRWRGAPGPDVSRPAGVYFISAWAGDTQNPPRRGSPDALPPRFGGGYNSALSKMLSDASFPRWTGRCLETSRSSPVLPGRVRCVAAHALQDARTCHPVAGQRPVDHRQHLVVSAPSHIVPPDDVSPVDLRSQPGLDLHPERHPHDRLPVALGDDPPSASAVRTARASRRVCTIRDSGCTLPVIRLACLARGSVQYSP